MIGRFFSKLFTPAFTPFSEFIFSLNIFTFFKVFSSFKNVIAEVSFSVVKCLMGHPGGPAPAITLRYMA
jgi:hypothetical protein